jgi:hypothetical protein
MYADQLEQTLISVAALSSMLLFMLVEVIVAICTNRLNLPSGACDSGAFGAKGWQP